MSFAKLKQPSFSLAGNIPENWRNFEERFDDFCTANAFRDTTKDPATQTEQYYISAKRPLELAALRLSLPDETLSLMRYTIAPLITSDDDKKKSWIWLQHLRTHYTGSCSSKLTDRYNFSALNQSSAESMKEWEIKVRQAGHLCEYGNMTDELSRDKFIFGIHERFKEIRVELLKTDKNEDKSDKTLAQVASLARSLETASSASHMIGSHHTEQVNYTRRNNYPANNSFRRAPPRQAQSTNSNPKRLPHRDLKLKRVPNTCWYCGQSPQHPWRECKAKNQECKNCGFMDHFSAVCLMKKRVNVLQEQEQSAVEADDDYYSDEYAYALNNNKLYRVEIKVSSDERDSFKTSVIHIDSGASVNTISEKALNDISRNPKIDPSTAILFPYGNDSPPLHPIGKVKLFCKSVSGTSFPISFHVLSDSQMYDQPCLLSGRDSEKLGLISFHPSVYALNERKQVPSPSDTVPTVLLPTRPALPLTKESFVKTYKSVLFDGLGRLGPPVHFELDPNITPVQMPVHRVPLSKRKEELEFIQKYVDAGILAKVTEPTPWCSNELIREKPATSERPRKFRVCIDPSQTINKAIKRPVFQMPILTENLHKLKKARIFTIIDVKDGFFNIPLDEESSLATTMHTTTGRYRWLVMPFGVSSAPEEFQMRLNTALEGIENIVIQADDILVFGVGDTDEEAEKDHDLALLNLAERGIQVNIRFNLPKLKFKLPRVMYNGEILTKNGVEPDPEKVKAIIDMPPPSDKPALHRYIGMLTYLSPFCPNLSSVLQPLRQLLQDDQMFIWSEVQHIAFETSKELISQAPVLSYYDTHKPVILQVDASSHGLGGALLQPDEQGKLKPVAYTSCSLSSAEQNYAQIEKECLAICQAFSKWDFWLYGNQQITVHTDHQPLVTILKKPLNKAPLRLQRMIMRLQRWSFDIVYKKGTSLHLADALSRAPLPTPQISKTDGFSVFRLDINELADEPNERLKPDTQDELKNAVRSDPSLQKLSAIIISGWPGERNQLENELKPYWPYRDELSVSQGIIYKGLQCLIPNAMQSSMLSKIHANHMGAESNYRMARQVVFWPGMRAAIYDMCHSCSRCAEYGSATPTEPMKTLPVPERPWQNLSQDTFDFEGKDYLVTVCHYTDWIEVDELPDLRSETIIHMTERLIGRFGIPDIIHSDCAPCFKSVAYKRFAAFYGFKKTFSSPYHSKGNGKAESAVKIVKSMLKKSSNINDALLMYRNTPPQDHTYSPAQRMFSRHTRTRLPTRGDLLNPVSDIDKNVVMSDIKDKKAKSKLQYDKKASPEQVPLEIGSYAYVKPPPAKKGNKWAYGKVVENSRARSYTIETPNGPVSRNRTHLRPAAAPPLVACRPMVPVQPKHPFHAPATAPPKVPVQPEHQYEAAPSSDQPPLQPAATAAVPDLPAPPPSERVKSPTAAPTRVSSRINKGVPAEKLDI